MFVAINLIRSNKQTHHRRRCSQLFSLARDPLSWTYYSFDSLDCFYFSSSATDLTAFSISSRDCTAVASYVD